MASAATGGFKFPGPVGTKRRRMRSGGNVSTLSNNEPPIVTLAEADDVGEKIVQTSKCKGATTIPIFITTAIGSGPDQAWIPYGRI